MKKHMLLLLIACSNSLLGMEKLKHALGLDGEKTQSGSSYAGARSRNIDRSYRTPFDRVGFWKKTVNALRRDNAKEEYIKHAESNLKRAETIQAHKGGFFSTFGRAKSRADYHKRVAKHKEPVTKEKPKAKKEVKPKKIKPATRAHKAKKA